jgi:hypothetical protein
MKRIAILAVALAPLWMVVQPTSAQDLSAQIVGVWKFVSNNSKEVASGKVVYPYGENPVGYIVYTKGGRLIFTLVGDKRAKPAGANATDAERVALFNTLATGSGTYKVEGNTLTTTYDSSWHQIWTGTTQKRMIAIAGNKLTITSAPTKNADGQDIVFENVMERAE